MRTPPALLALSLAVLACDAGPDAPAIGFTYNWGDDDLERFIEAQVNGDATASPIRVLTSREGGWQAFGASPMAAEVKRAQLLSEDRDVVVVVGPGGSREVLQVAPIYGEAGLPLLVPTATSRLLDAAGAHLFRLAADDSVQGEFIATFADSVLQARSIAVYHVPDEYGIGLAAGTVATARARGLALRERTPVRLLQACADDNGRRYYENLTRELDQRGRPDAVVLAMRTVEAACFTKALRARWPAIAIIAGDGVYLDNSFLSGAGDAAVGTYLVAFWHPDLPHAASKRFVQAYRATVGRPPRHGDAVFVDAAVLAATAIRSGAGTRDAITDYLRGLGRERPPFAGIIGPISFAPGAARPLYMTRVERDGSSLLVTR